MTTSQIIVLWAALLVAMLAFRWLPMILLKGRSLPPRVERAIGLIPAAAFAALVANDLVRPADYAARPMAAVPALASAAIVALVARKTGSLVWCAVVGMACFALLGLLV